MVPPPAGDDAIDSTLEDTEPVQVLIRVAASARFFRAGDGRHYAELPVGIRREIHGLRSPAFRDWLSRGYWNDCHELPPGWAMERLLDVLDAVARFEHGTASCFIRVGRDGDHDGHTSYLDLGDPSGQAIKIEPAGWSVIDCPPVDFDRPEGLLPLPIPVSGGSIELLRSYVNLSEPDFRRLIAWMAGALRPVGPFPVLVLGGAPRSARSTLARVLRLLIDPHTRNLAPQPGNSRDLIVAAVDNWVLAYDDVSVIPWWVTSRPCRPVFGTGFASRGQVSSDHRSRESAQRPIILSGVDHSLRHGELFDRALVLNLPPIAPALRRAEREFWTSFQADYPKILGAVLDAKVDLLRAAPSNRTPDAALPASFPRRGESVTRGRGRTAPRFPSRDIADSQEPTVNAPGDPPVENALLQIAPVWRTGRPPLPSSTTRPRKTWAPKSPPWPTRRKLVHRNGFPSPFGAGFLPKRRRGTLT